ncbi:MAG: LrgB family protein [Eubacteriales bacterium]|nr:LrgB family protein [Eubacteriales bacterium]
MSSFLGTSVFFGLAISLASYELGILLNRRLRSPLLNPLLVAIVLVIVTLKVLHIDYAHYNDGAKFLSYLLTPTTVSLAIPLYLQLHLLKKNFKAISVGIFAGVVASLGSIWLLALAFNLDHLMYVTLLPKSITSAIGMGLTAELGGNVTITVATIVITGIIGNMTAESICRLFKIDDPVARGIAIGTSSHAAGTSKAMEMGEIEGAMSSLAIVVAGLVTVVLASFFAPLI